jgi:hypothetical protein
VCNELAPDTLQPVRSCRFENMKALRREGERLRQCFADGLGAIAEHIASDSVWQLE